MDWAKRTAELSYAQRLKVGAVIVKDDSVISYGYNGTPAGWDNSCEYETVDSYAGLEGAVVSYRLVTKPEVLHAEMNSLMKLAKGPNSGNGALMFITHSPCLECAKGIYQAGIKEVFYGEDYRTTDGIDFLKKCGVIVNKYND